VPSRPSSEALYRAVARDAGGECGYCRAPQRALPYRLEIEHIAPALLGGGDDLSNLWLSCHKCNKLKSNHVVGTDPLTQKVTSLFNPRQNEWTDHFSWQGGGLFIIGRTAIGRVTVDLLRLNDAYYQSARQVWILAGIYPPPTYASDQS
jgi:hypothetical protein